MLVAHDGLRRLRMAAGVFLICASAPLAGQTLSERLASADPVLGSQAFVQCRVCHTSSAGGGTLVGPNLWNVLGRQIASLPGFDYSSALQRVQGVWSYEALDAFLENPTAFVPGTRMVFAGVKNSTIRADVIAHLRSLSDAPLPIPTQATSTSLSTTGQAEKPPVESIDAFGDDWPQGVGRNETGFTCNSCHSLAIVKQQGLSRGDWDDLLVWMVEEQGMPELSPQARDRVLDFLARNFGRDRKLK